MTTEPLLNIYTFNNNNKDLFSTFYPIAEVLQNCLLHKKGPLLYLGHNSSTPSNNNYNKWEVNYFYQNLHTLKTKVTSMFSIARSLKYRYLCKNACRKNHLKKKYWSTDLLKCSFQPWLHSLSPLPLPTSSSYRGEYHRTGLCDRIGSMVTNIFWVRLVYWHARKRGQHTGFVKKKLKEQNTWKQKHRCQNNIKAKKYFG